MDPISKRTRSRIVKKDGGDISRTQGEKRAGAAGVGGGERAAEGGAPQLSDVLAKKKRRRRKVNKVKVES